MLGGATAYFFLHLYLEQTVSAKSSNSVSAITAWTALHGQFGLLLGGLRKANRAELAIEDYTVRVWSSVSWQLCGVLICADLAKTRMVKQFTRQIWSRTLQQRWKKKYRKGILLSSLISPTNYWEVLELAITEEIRNSFLSIYQTLCTF